MPSLGGKSTEMSGTMESNTEVIERVHPEEVPEPASEQVAEDSQERGVIAAEVEGYDLVARPPERSRRGPQLSGLGGLGVSRAGLAVAIVAVTWVFMAPTYVIFSITVGLVLAIATLGLLPVVGWIREISLMQAGLVGTALYFCAYAYRDAAGLGLPFPVAAAVGTSVVVGISLLVALASARLSGVYVLVLTLAVQFMIMTTVFSSSRLSGGLAAPATPRPTFFMMDMISDTSFYFYVLGCLVAVLLFMYRFRNSKFGRSMIAVGNDQQAAAAVGISPWRYKIGAFVISGLLAGVAGALSAPLYGSPPGPLEYTVFSSLLYLAIPVVAGFDSLLGVVGVAIFFVLAPQLLEALHIAPEILAGVALTFGILLGRRGVAGAISQFLKNRRIRAAKRSEEDEMGAVGREAA